MTEGEAIEVGAAQQFVKESTRVRRNDAVRTRQEEEARQSSSEGARRTGSSRAFCR
jgi:hypothetical protein